MSSSRNLPIVEYLRQLQLEYLLYQLRIKIYANSEDRKKFKEILTFKKEKITDICTYNLEEATCRITDSNSKIHDNIDINLIRRIL
jgi:hypothetical protein